MRWFRLFADVFVHQKKVVCGGAGNSYGWDDSRGLDRRGEHDSGGLDSLYKPGLVWRVPADLAGVPT